MWLTSLGTWPNWRCSTLRLTRCQFHQHFTRKFFIPKCFLQLSNFSLALQFSVERLLAQKLLVKCWLNWLQVFTPSIIGAASLALARHSYGLPAWDTDLMEKSGGMRVSDFKVCIARLYETSLKASENPQQAVFEKYKDDKWVDNCSWIRFDQGLSAFSVATGTECITDLD